jgi:hypothetical protein
MFISKQISKHYILLLGLKSFFFFIVYNTMQYKEVMLMGEQYNFPFVE